jgi:hypothetical protein
MADGVSMDPIANVEMGSTLRRRLGERSKENGKRH